MLSKRYELTEVDRRTWLHVPSGTPWSTSSDTHQVVEIKKRLLLRCIHHFKSYWINDMDHMRIHFSSRTQCNRRQHTFCILLHAAIHLFIYVRKAFEEYYDIQIAIDHEMKLKIYYISIFWLNSFGYIVGCEYIFDLTMHTNRSDPWHSWLER